MTEHHLEFLRLKEGYTGSPGSALFKMPHCWKSHAVIEYYVSCCNLNRHQAECQAA